jgi:hypothetical protein
MFLPQGNSFQIRVGSAYGSVQSAYVRVYSLLCDPMLKILQVGDCIRNILDKHHFTEPAAKPFQAKVQPRKRPLHPWLPSLATGVKAPKHEKRCPGLTWFVD